MKIHKPTASRAEHERARRVAAGQERPSTPSPAHPEPHAPRSPRTPAEADRWRR